MCEVVSDSPEHLQGMLKIFIDKPEAMSKCYFRGKCAKCSVRVKKGVSPTRMSVQNVLQYPLKIHVDTRGGKNHGCSLTFPYERTQKRKNVFY